MRGRARPAKVGALLGYADHRNGAGIGDDGTCRGHRSRGTGTSATDSPLSSGAFARSTLGTKTANVALTSGSARLSVPLGSSNIEMAAKLA